MSKFMVLLYDDQSQWGALSPEQIQEAVQKYWAWGDNLRKKGIYLGSDKLTDGVGRVLRGKKDLRVTDGPFTEGKEFLGGYYAFTAASYDEAVELTRDHPHLEYGGVVEIREIENMKRD